MYQKIRDQVKSGDLICYDAPGLLPSMTKIVTNSPYSRIGLVFEAPTKYSRHNDLFVFEVRFLPLSPTTSICPLRLRRVFFCLPY